MKQSFLFANLIFILSLFTSCGSSKTIAGDTTSYVTPIICAEEYSQKYNMQLDFMKHHFSGLLIVRKLPDNEIRINSCIEPMKKKKMLLLLETDFKNLFLSGKNIRIKKKSSTFEKRVTGRGFGKTVFYLSEFNSGHPEQIKIKHPWLRLSIQLDKLKENPN